MAMTDAEMRAFRASLADRSYDNIMLYLQSDVPGFFNAPRMTDVVDRVIQLEEMECTIRARILTYSAAESAATVFKQSLARVEELKQRCFADANYDDCRWPTVTFGADRAMVQSARSFAERRGIILGLIRSTQTRINTSTAMLERIMHNHNVTSMVHASLMKSHWLLRILNRELGENAG